MILLHDGPMEEGFTLAALLARRQILSHFILGNALLLALLSIQTGSVLGGFGVDVSRLASRQGRPQELASGVR